MRKKIVKSNELNEPITNYDIMNQMADINEFMGVYSKDELPGSLPTGHAIIINLDDSTGSGTHWTALYNSGKGMEYFDSFGLPPTQSVERLMKKMNKKKFGCLYTTLQIQPIMSNKCGWYSMKYIRARMDDVPVEDILYSFSRISHPMQVVMDDDIKL